MWWCLFPFASMASREHWIPTKMVREGGSTAWPVSLGWGWQALSWLFALSFGFAASTAARQAPFPQQCPSWSLILIHRHSFWSRRSWENWGGEYNHLFTSQASWSPGWRIGSRLPEPHLVSLGIGKSKPVRLGPSVSWSKECCRYERKHLESLLWVLKPTDTTILVPNGWLY